MNPTGPVLSPLRKALVSIERLQARVRTLEAQRSQPIAIVGIGCRLPGGATNAASFFDGLLAGRDAIIDRPARPGPAIPDSDRFPSAGYLDMDVGAFDAPFFGISPREAASIDPQHRLLLECAWESLENAGIDPQSLHGSRAGVFVGMAGNDYAIMQLRSHRRDELLHSHFASGSGHSMVSGRLSYVLGLHGPSITIDTACSSSLVAVHLGCQSLRTGESDVAFAAGVNLILAGDYTRAFDKAQMLAPDGRCKTFDAAADGFARAEGCGVLLLKRLGDAERDGDRILAVIRGSAVNQDGPSSGLTAPNGPAQVAVIRAALADAQLDPADIGYIEAHGTGTSLGDPIEVQALGSVFGTAERADNPLLIGSVKSNVGHLEAAAGVAGIIKMVESLRRAVIPANLHFRTPNPHIPWAELPIAVVAENVAFPGHDGARRAGVSSFGFSGTNVHVILEATADKPASSVSAAGTKLLTLSAATPTALHECARHMASFLERTDARFDDVCHTANTGRARLAHRMAIPAATGDAALHELKSFLAGDDTNAVRTGSIDLANPMTLAFLYTGQGAQYAGMAWSLRDRSPIVRRVLDECSDLLRDELDEPLLSVLDPSSRHAALVDRTDFTQPALFAVQVALAELWHSWGIRPAVVLGHSIGEYAAAYMAGVFRLDDALRVVAARGRLMHAVEAAGRMVAVIADEAHVERWVADDARLSIAAINAPGQVVVSGAADAVSELEARAASAGIQTKPLRTSHAFHSPLMDGVVSALDDILERVELRPADRVRFISTVTGASVVPDALADRHYWSSQARLPVRFADAVQVAARMAVRGIEIGPHPTLAGLAALGGVQLPIHASLKRDHDAWDTLMSAAADLHVNGAPIALHAIETEPQAHRIDLPTYPFERQSLWVNIGTGTIPERRGGHALLGLRIPQPGDDIAFDSVLAADAPAFIGEHRVHGHALLPGMAFVEMALAAARSVMGATAELSAVDLLEPMAFTDGARRVHTRIDSCGGTFSIHSAAIEPENAEWTLHCAGRVAHATGTEERVDIDAVRALCTRSMDADAFAQTLIDHGYDFGPRLHGVQEVHAGEGLALGRVALPAECADDPDDYVAHPLLLDAAVQTVGAALAGDSASVWVPMHIERVVCVSALAQSADVVCRVDQREPASPRADVTLIGAMDDVLVRIEGIAFRALQRSQLERDEFLETRWLPVLDDTATANVHRSDAASLCTRSLGELAVREDAVSYDRFVAMLEERSAAYVANAFVDLGWMPKPGDMVYAEQLAESLRIVPVQRRLFARMLEILGEMHIVERVSADEWRVARPIARLNPDRTVGDMPMPAGIANAMAQPPAERVLLDRCGPRLADVLRGDDDPLELLFPAGGADDAERMYSDAPFARIFNMTIADVVAAAARTAPAGRPLRVLEVGAGTGGTTRRVLERLDADGLRVEYTFTDISPLFVERARAKWSARDDVRYALFDLDRDIAVQGFRAGTFDVVIAANCLHASRDLRAALGRTRSLLRAGGMLAAVEVFARHRWFDLTVGLTEGWWHFTDTDVRPSYPCIDARAWTQVLEDGGYTDINVLPLSTNIATARASSGQGVILGWRSTDPVRQERWLVVGDDDLARGIAGAIEASGCRAHTTDHAAIANALGQSQHWDGVALCSPASSRPDIAHTVRNGFECLSAMAARIGAGACSIDTLCIISRGAQVATAGDVDADPAAATLWGGARSFEIELPDVRVRRLDLDATPHRTDPDRVIGWLFDDIDEPELACRFGMMHARRLADRDRTRRALPDEYRLAPPTQHSLDDVAFTSGSRRAPAAGQVEIRAAASGVNFKDVLNVLGMYPGDPGPLGSECAGIVTAVGDGVSIPVGTAVMAAAGHSYGRHVIADARLVSKKPAALTFAQAAALPVAYLTASFALEHCARLVAGERVLVHAAAGGVGMAAVAIAQHLGAEVFATAGSESKRDLLRAAGVRHVFDSRSASFAQEILDATSGAGVHVVLNSLADELIEPSFNVLAAGGRFLEIGKRGIWSHDRVGALGRNIEYHIIDWGETASQEPDLVSRVFANVMERVARSELPALPVTMFPLERAADAFRFMAQGRHTGRIVLTHPVHDFMEPIEFHRDRTYIITGGTAGLGLVTAEFAAAQGAGRLVLVSRSGVPERNRDRVAALRDAGVDIMTCAADVGDRASVEQLAATLRDAGIDRVDGIIHSAGALSDRTLQHATLSDFNTVLHAKVHGTVLLDAAFEPRFFMSYSSVASVLGAPGQANHAAACAFQDTYAAAAWGSGRAGMSIGWGPWSETGSAARTDVLARARSRGLVPLTTREALVWLARACSRPAVHLVGARIDDEVRASDNSPLLSMLRPATRAIKRADKPRDENRAARFIDELEAAPADARRSLVLNHIRTRIRRVLGLAANAPLDANRPLGEIGLDSLLAVELRNILADDTGQRLSATLLFDHATPAALTAHLMEVTGMRAAAEARSRQDAPDTSSDDILSALESLDDDDVDRMLAEKLKHA